MRFLLAIVAFVAAAVMIVAGIAQRTVFAPPSQVTVSTTVPDSARYVMISGAALNAHSGQQTLSLTGAPDPKTQMVAIGRTDDMKAWLGTEKYVAVGYDSTTGKLTTRSVAPKPTPAPTATPAPAETPAPTATSETSVPGASDASEASSPDPAGSDLWLEEYDGEDASVTRMNVPDGVSVLVASGGTAPAPSDIAITWPLDSSTPWAVPLIISGLVLLVIGLVLYLWGLYAHRKSRGPRRKSGPKMPKLPKTPTYKPTADVEAAPRGRRSTRRARMILPAVPVLLVVALSSGVSAGAGPAVADEMTTPTPTPTATSTPGPQPANQSPPVVTVPQLERIMKRVSASADDADAKADPNLAKERFTGAALQLRDANYTIRAKKADQPLLPAIPAAPIALSLPQATDSWPRSILAVMEMPKDAEGQDQAPQALILVQNTPRENYKIEYATSLEPKATVPNLAPANIGAAVVRPDSKLLALPPNQVAAAYGDVLINGDQSTYADLFNAEGDTLRTAVGAEWKAQQMAAVPATASLTFTSAAGPSPEIAMATNDSGALIWVSLQEAQQLKVVEAGAEVNAGPTAAALGVASSKTGIETIYGYQLAFYVPPAGSDAKITLLGFAQGMVGATEIQ